MHYCINLINLFFYLNTEKDFYYNITYAQINNLYWNSDLIVGYVNNDNNYNIRSYLKICINNELFFSKTNGTIIYRCKSKIFFIILTFINFFFKQHFTIGFRIISL